MSQLKAPPLGIQPEWAWREQRAVDIMDGIRRYIEGCEKIPDEWQSELSQHLDWINNRKRGMGPKRVEINS